MGVVELRATIEMCLPPLYRCGSYSCQLPCTEHHQPLPCHSEHNPVALFDPSLFAMLDSFEILSTSGVVLWSKSYASVNSSVINALITDVFIEERITPAPNGDARNPQYKKDQYALKWKTVKDLGLIFIVSNGLSPLPCDGR
jgi:Signal recognition particle, alpha subunit, N-terminal